MFGKLFLLFAVMPIVEIALLVNVGEQIGGWNTVAIVIATAIAGAHLVRREGLQTLFQAQTKMQSGQLPGQQMAEGLLLVVAGVLLVTPGFITDILGFLFALPVTRPLIAKAVMKQFSVKVQTSAQQQSHFYYSSQQHQQPNQHGDVFEGEFERKDDNQRPKLGE